MNIVKMANRREYEIKQFLLEIEELMKAAENMTIKTGIKFDPFLFMLWRLYRKNE